MNQRNRTGKKPPASVVHTSGSGRAVRASAGGTPGGTTPKQHPNPRIVRVWFDALVNPLLDNLRVEYERVKERTWVWRWRHHIVSAAFPLGYFLYWNGCNDPEQFFQTDSRFHPAITRYMASIRELIDTCASLHEAISSDDHFKAVYRTATSSTSLHRLGMTAKAVFGGYPKEKRPGLIVEHIINRTPSTAAAPLSDQFWSVWHDEFLQVLDTEDLRPHVVRMNAAGERMLDAIAHLIEILEEVRSRLSVKYGVPYS